jgi:hypothetical protein
VDEVGRDGMIESRWSRPASTRLTSAAPSISTGAARRSGLLVHLLIDLESVIAFEKGVDSSCMVILTAMADQDMAPSHLDHCIE